MTDAYRVRIFESELRVICDEALDYSHIETGGNLYGLFSHGGSPTILLATRPAGRFYRGAASLDLDHQVQNEIEESVWARYGIQFLGMWHSHHQIGLYEPSSGDRNRTRNYAVKWHRKFYLEVLCNLPQDGYSSRWPDRRPPAGVVPAAEASDGRDSEGRERMQRRGQSKEERRRGRDDENRPGRWSRKPAEEYGRERSIGPVRVAPFVYVDATRLECADAEFVLLEGVSPVRAAILAADAPGALADAFRPASTDPRAGISYDLGTSRADRPGAIRRLLGTSGHDARENAFEDEPAVTVEPAAQSPVSPQEPTSEREPAHTQGPANDRPPAGDNTLAIASQESDASPRRGPEQPAAPAPTNTAIPDMAAYVRDYIEPLLRTRRDFRSTLQPINAEKLALIVRSHYSDLDLLMILGWDGAAPVCLSCAIRSGGTAVAFPERLHNRDITGAFYWGTKQLQRHWG